MNILLSWLQSFSAPCTMAAGSLGMMLYSLASPRFFRGGLVVLTLAALALLLLTWHTPVPLCRDLTANPWIYMMQAVLLHENPGIGGQVADLHDAGGTSSGVVGLSFGAQFLAHVAQTDDARYPAASFAVSGGDVGQSAFSILSDSFLMLGNFVITPLHQHRRRTRMERSP